MASRIFWDTFFDRLALGMASGQNGAEDVVTAFRLFFKNHSKPMRHCGASVGLIVLDSGSGIAAAAFFVFFAGAAGTKIVAAGFGASADLLGGFGFFGAGLQLQILLGAALTALNLLGLFFGARGLHQVEEANRFRVDAAHHFLEKLEAFLFEFDEWVDLAVAA